MGGTPTVFARVSEEIAWINSYIDLWSGGGGGTTPTPPAPTPPGTCTNDPSFIDSFGDCCDAGSGTANEACCICGGGITSPSSPGTPAPVAPTPVTPAPVSSGTCTNDPSFIDSFGDDCTWYEENDPDCSFGDCCDAGSGTANEACCICGGGITSPSPGTTPAPVTSAPVPSPGSGSVQDALDLLNEAVEILEGL